MKQTSAKLIFIVDDDPDDRQFILDALTASNQDIDHLFINNAQELLSVLSAPENRLPDLILLDLNMPGIMGLQALKEIRHNDSFNQIPIIILTTSALEKDKKLSYDYGANCFLVKSHSYKKMIEIVNAILKLWLEF
jgi:DNA-binding response OmpR family regulator